MTRTFFKRFVFILLFVSVATVGRAQVLNAKVGINGLTCSQCSRSVEMQLRRLSFVKNVDMNLEQTEGCLQFREGAAIDFSKIAKAVRDAGFSVRFLQAEIDLSGASIKANGFTIGGETFRVEGKQPPATGKSIFIFKGKQFSSGKDRATGEASTGKVYSVRLAS